MNRTLVLVKKLGPGEGKGREGMVCGWMLITATDDDEKGEEKVNEEEEGDGHSGYPFLFLFVLWMGIHSKVGFALQLVNH